MKLSRTFTGSLVIIVLLAGSLLASCSPSAPVAAQPTQDPATIVAAAVSTLRSQMRMTEQAMPTPMPTATATTIPTETPIPATATPSAPTLTPTATATTAPAISAKFLSAGAFPENKAERVPNERFSVAIRFLNTGTTGWVPGYRLKLVNFQGEATVQLEAELGQGVDPGKPVEFDLWAYGSETLGTHIWYFQLYTPQGVPVPGGVASYSYKSH